MRIYLAGSLQNKKIIEYAKDLRSQLNYWDVVFDDWMAAHPKADDNWKEYSIIRGQTYEQALNSPAGKQVFEFDKQNIDMSDCLVLVLPAGKSAHLEAGYVAGSRGKRLYILLDKEDIRWDVMYGYAHTVFTEFKDLVEQLRADSNIIAQYGRYP